MNLLKSSNIMGIETLWFSNVNNPIETIRPMLELIYNMGNGKYSYFTANTREELRFVFSKIKVADAGIIYLASHGRSNSFAFGNGNTDELSLGELGEFLKNKLEDKVIHVSSCSFLDLDDEDAVNKFVNVTRATFISGYTKSVDWMEALCLDLLWLNYLQLGNEDIKKTIKSFTKRYDQLITQTGFNIYLKGIK